MKQLTLMSDNSESLHLNLETYGGNGAVECQMTVFSGQKEQNEATLTRSCYGQMESSYKWESTYRSYSDTE